MREIIETKVVAVLAVLDRDAHRGAARASGDWAGGDRDHCGAALHGQAGGARSSRLNRSWRRIPPRRPPSSRRPSCEHGAVGVRHRGGCGSGTACVARPAPPPPSCPWRRTRRAWRGATQLDGAIHRLDVERLAELHDRGWCCPAPGAAVAGAVLAAHLALRCTGSVPVRPEPSLSFEVGQALEAERAAEADHGRLAHLRALGDQRAIGSFSAVRGLSSTKVATRRSAIDSDFARIARARAAGCRLPGRARGGQQRGQTPIKVFAFSAVST